MRILSWCPVAVLAAMLFAGCSAQKRFSRSFVGISREDPRYFALSNGKTFVPIGCNIAALANRTAVERYVQALADNGANFGRVWLNSALFEVETEYGRLDEAHLSNIEYLLELAQRHDLKIKLCIESFRHIRPGRNRWDTKASYHVSNGGPFENAAEFIAMQRGRDEYLRRLEIIRKRVGDHPAVFGWELWNEMNAVDCPEIREWNEYMLPRVKRMFPKNLVMQSLGSLDRRSSFAIYGDICGMPANEVMQVHRYLDPGAELAVCRAPMDSLCSDAVAVLRGYGRKKPLLLAEGGAVQPDHAGPSLLYARDTAGILLHDVIFTPFFSGAAGPGHSWHWDHYIEKHDLWYHFKRFARAIESIDPAAEHFEPLRADSGRLKGYALQGRRHLLVWFRDSENNWQTEFEENRAPELLRGQRIDLSKLLSGRKIRSVNVYDPWNDVRSEVAAGTRICLPDFKRSLVVKISYK
ncbi:hypothetical protein [Alistipes sp.]|uniref:hypothetical protein n=1 Tax=Alistipes sp. TaxID=1872444 RepID=UPI003AF1B11B